MSEEDEISSKRAKGPLDVSRRALLIGAGSTAALLGLGALRYAGHNPLVRPPGGQDEENLVSRCVHCYRCIEACPEKVIVAASLDAGVLNMRTPRSPRDLSQERNSRQHSADSVNPSAAPMTSR